MGTIINKPGGGGGAQVGYKGFKYNVNTYGYPAAPGPGQAVIYEGCGEECYYVGFYINRYDANGTDIYLILSKLSAQPFTIVTATGVTVSNTTGSELIGDYFSILGLGATPYAYGVSYFDFGTSNPITKGYTLAGSLNGTALTTGTYYLSPGSTTANTNITTRTITVPNAGTIECYIIISGTSSTMSVNLMINGVAQAPYYAMPLIGGLPTGRYLVCGTTAITANAAVSLRIVQGAGTSYNIEGFGYTIT